jgi:catechol 2,3-dioxygenase-like lactoylglutathione lyase family enzyme
VLRRLADQARRSAAGGAVRVVCSDSVEILSSRVLVQPADLERSLCFYEQTLALAIYREWGAGASRGVVFFLGGGLLEISGASAQAPSPATALVLQVRDVHAARQHLAEQRVAIEAEPERKSWGLTEMTVRDPDGLALIFVEVPADHPRRHGWHGQTTRSGLRAAARRVRISDDVVVVEREARAGRDTGKRPVRERDRHASAFGDQLRPAAQ